MDNELNNINIDPSDLTITENGHDKSHNKMPNSSLVVSNDLQAFGAEQSAKVSGNPQVLNTHLEWFFQDALRNANGKNYEQQKKIDELNKEITGLESNNDKLLNDIKNIESKITLTEKEITEKREIETQDIADKRKSINNKQIEIDKIKNGDYSVLGTEVKPGDRLGYFLGLAIWSILTFYLVIFYTSVIHSAFILDPVKAAIAGAQKGAFFSMTIVNLNAIPETFQIYGVIGVAFLLFATFMFIALGYLIHKFSRSEQHAKAISVYAFTFLFDALLAYTIVEKIYNVERNAGKVGSDGKTLPAWDWHYVFATMDFWIILMAGFAVYIIWGFILEYMISEYDNIVPARVGIKTRETEISQLEQQIVDIKDKYSKIIAQLLSKCEDLKNEKNDIRAKIDNNTTAVEIKRTDITTLERTISVSIGDLKTKISQFLIGWCSQIKMTYNAEESKVLISDCHNRLDTFYKNIKID